VPQPSNRHDLPHSADQGYHDVGVHHGGYYTYYPSIYFAFGIVLCPNSADRIYLYSIHEMSSRILEWKKKKSSCQVKDYFAAGSNIRVEKGNDLEHDFILSQDSQILEV
jgi:hypothetical protein